MISHRVRPLMTSAVLVVPLLIAIPATADAAPAKPAANTCGPVARFSAHHFPKRPEIDNRWLPLVPGANTELRGTVVGDDGELHQHSIVATVTDLTKVINGVRTLVVFERDLDNGTIQESELAFEAQDRAGRVWNVGEYPEEYEEGQLVGAPSTWIAGIAGARAGIGMLNRPRLHTPAYEQGRAPAVGFFDCGKVTKTGQRVCVPVGCFGNVLVIDEFAPLDPAGGHQLKYYAPHVGNIKVGAAGGDNPEVLTLVKRNKLGAAALATIRAQVIDQDRRGYQVSKKVYGRTPPVQRLKPAC
jgi:hypothetical protein